MKTTWTDVDRYFNDSLIGPDPALESVIEANARAELPSIDVSPAQGKFLYLLARLQSARKILEIGTLGGYSTIWLARALSPEGKVISLELEPRHAEVARANIEKAGLSERVEIHLGRALDSLEALEKEHAGPFDLIFIDADKETIPDYFTWALKLSRPGSAIVVDNVVRDGHVIDGASADASVQGVRRFVEMLSSDSRATGTAIQTVGLKGYDGFILAVVNEAS